MNEVNSLPHYQQPPAINERRNTICLNYVSAPRCVVKLHKVSAVCNCSLSEYSKELVTKVECKEERKKRS